MKKLSAVLALCLTLVLLISPMGASASFFDDIFDDDNEDYFTDYTFNDVGYYISKYNVNIDVNEDNTLHITENISVCFTLESHGIFREIPYKVTVSREDGSVSRKKVKISNIDCNEQFEKSTDDGSYILKIGDPDRYIEGKHDYVISYNYKIGMDTLEGADELYYNIIGNGWETTIDDLSFTINMPKEFDKSKLGFSTGLYGDSGSDIIEYEVNGNTITGRCTATLKPHWAVTVRTELPEGYFKFNSALQNFLTALLIIIPLAILAAIFIIWLKFGKDKKVVEVIEFYPPDGMSCVDVAYWNKGMITKEDVVPLLFELANEGYVSIEETNKSSFIIKELKSYEGTDEAKKIYMSGLFKGDRHVANKLSLENNFYVYAEEIVELYNTYKNRTKIYFRKSLIMRIICWLMIIAGIVLNTIVYNAVFATSIATYLYYAGFGVSIVSLILSFLVRRRTDEGHEKLQKIKGFKLFLETAEKERLETLVEESPDYFYDILPYAYVLGVYTKWVKKFESIAFEPPRWYVGTNMGNRIMLMRFMNHTMSSCQRAMLSTPSSNTGSAGHIGSGGSGFSGGGFSGGGFGGGGGGRW